MRSSSKGRLRAPARFCYSEGTVPSVSNVSGMTRYHHGMLYAFWLANGIVLPRAANMPSPLPDARLLGHSMAVTVQDELDLIQLLRLQASELEGKPLQTVADAL
jgi:hypothetical protein